MRFYLSFFILLFVVSCSSKKSSSDQKKVLRYNEIAGISNLDPTKAIRFEGIWAMSQLYNGLVRLDDNLELQEDAAKRWEMDRTKTVYTFHLRTDMYFHDHEAFVETNGKGRKLVAQDFINSFQRILDPENSSSGKFIFKNLDKYATINNMGMEAPNDSTLVIHLKKPQHSFLKMMTLPFCYAVPIEVVDFYGEDFTRNPVGTGPFKFKVWRTGDKLVLLKNENYHEFDKKGNRLPYLDAVSISFIKSAQTEFQSFIQGDLDFMSGIDHSYQTTLLDADGNLREKYADKMYMQKQAWLKTDYIGILVDEDQPIVRNSALKSRLVRRAVNYAINREKLVQFERTGVGVYDINGFVPKGINDYNGKKVKGYRYDPEQAKQLLSEAGYTGESIKPKVTLVTVNQYKGICENIVTDLNECGFDAKMESVLPSLHKQKVANFNTNFFRKSWTGDFPDPINFLYLFSSDAFAPDNGPNYTHFSNEQYDIWLERAESDISEEERQETYYKMDQMIKDEAPVVPLFYDELIKFVSTRVSGLKANSMNSLDLRYVRIQD